MTDVSFLGSRTWSVSASGSGSGCGRSGTGCGSCREDRAGSGRSHGCHRGAPVHAHGPQPTWSGSGSRSGSRSAIWTWSMSRRTWTTSSWSGKKSALGFWICSETGRGRCRERPGEWCTSNFPEDPRRAGLGTDLPIPLRGLGSRSQLITHDGKPLWGWRLRCSLGPCGENPPQNQAEIGPPSVCPSGEPGRPGA